MSKSTPKPAEPEVLKGDADAHDDDLIVAPKGKSRGQFIFILGLMVFTLIIFTVGDMFQMLFTGQDSRSNETYFSFEMPDGRRIEKDWTEFAQVKQALDNFYYANYGFQGARDVDLSDELAARFLILEAEAEAAGVYVSDRELGLGLLNGFGVPGSPFSLFGFQNAANYRGIAQSVGIPVSELDATARRIIRVARYQTLLTAAGTYADGEAVEALWKEQNPERAYDYVKVAVADYKATAEAEVPNDEELEAWYVDLPQRNSVFNEQFVLERTRAEFAGLSAGSMDNATQLLEKYPLEEGIEIDQLASEYWETVRSSRFVRPVEEQPAVEDEPDMIKRLYYPYEEVEEICKAEAPVHRALVSWLLDLQTASTSEEGLDLAAEAEALGLELISDGVARTRTDWTEREDGIGGPSVAADLATAGAATQLTLDVITIEDGLFIGHIVERIPSGLPEMSEIRDIVVEKWIEDRAKTLAEEALEAQREALRQVVAEAEENDENTEGEDPEGGDPEDGGNGEDDTLPDGLNGENNPIVTDEQFRTQLESAGFTVERRDWLRTNAPSSLDPKGDDPAHEFIAGNFLLSLLEEGEVAEPNTDGDDEFVYLIRCVGDRDAEEADLDPVTYERLSAQVMAETHNEITERLFSIERLKEDYDLFLRDSKSEDAESGSESGEDDGADDGASE